MGYTPSSLVLLKPGWRCVSGALPRNSPRCVVPCVSITLQICSSFLALHINVFFNPGPGSNVSLYTQRNPYWHLATTRRRTCVRYRNSLSSSAALPTDRSSSACVRVGISKLSRSRFVESVIRKERRRTRSVLTLPTRGRLTNRARERSVPFRPGSNLDLESLLGCGSRIPGVQVT